MYTYSALPACLILIFLLLASLQVVKFIGSRKNLTEDKFDELEEMVMDSTKVEAIFDAAKMSMGKVGS